MAKAFFEKDENRKKELQTKFSTETLPAALKLFDERIGKVGSGFLASSGLTWADLYLFCVLEWLGDKREAVLENFKNVKAHEQKIKSIPNIAAWLAKRPKTDMQNNIKLKPLDKNDLNDFFSILAYIRNFICLALINYIFVLFLVKIKVLLFNKIFNL